jgi:hypothetical protein
VGSTGAAVSVGGGSFGLTGSLVGSNGGDVGGCGIVGCGIVGGGGIVGDADNVVILVGCWLPAAERVGCAGGGIVAVITAGLKVGWVGAVPSGRGYGFASGVGESRVRSPWLEGLGLGVRAASAIGSPVAISAGVPLAGEGYASPLEAPPPGVDTTPASVAPGSGYDPLVGKPVGAPLTGVSDSVGDVGTTWPV